MKHGLCLCRSLCFYIKHNVRTSISLLDERTGEFYKFLCYLRFKRYTTETRHKSRKQNLFINYLAVLRAHLEHYWQ